MNISSPDRIDAVRSRTLTSMRSRTTALAIAACLAVAACGSEDPAPAADPSSQDAESDLLGFEAAAVDGSLVDVDALQGHDVVIWFWAPW